MLVTVSLTFLLAGALGEDKTWQWGNSFHDSSRWTGGKTPCPGQAVSIPGDVVFLSTPVSVSQLELGVGGMVVVGETGSLRLMSGPTSSSRPECLNSSVVPATFSSARAGAWLDPANWRARLSARPHCEQVPCQHDTVILPPNMAYRLALTQTDVTVAGLILGGRRLDSVGWRSVLRTEVGRKMFNVTREVVVTGSHCRDWRGCQCGTHHLEDLICSHAGGGQCEPPACNSPLRPRGHCCYNYCGAVISLTTTAGLDTLRTVASHHAGSSSDFYVRRLEEDRYEIMLVPVSGNLTATHTAAAHIQSYLLLELRTSVSSVWVEYSGAGPPPGALARLGTALGWLTLFSLVIMSAVLLNRRYSSVPLTQYRTRLQAQFSGFAMFKNTWEGEVVLRGIQTGADGDVSDTAEVEMVKSEELIGTESGSRSFTNPMFNIEPPSNIYSDQPTKDITFGVENPTYVALEELGKDCNIGSSHYEVIDIHQDQAKREESEIEAPVINPETKETNTAESKTSSEEEEELNTNINKETPNVIANSSNEIFENLAGDNETLLDLSDIFENIQDKEEGEVEDISAGGQSVPGPDLEE